jgi:UDP-sugar pyrophosphorylase
VVKAVKGARVIINGSFENEGLKLIQLSEEELSDSEIPEYIRIRGYRFEDQATALYEFDQPGEYCIGD